MHVELRLGFVKVPAKGDPQHHGDLPGRRGDGLEVAVWGIDNIRDVELIAGQGRACESDDSWPERSLSLVDLSRSASFFIRHLAVWPVLS
jgi:hypothetical protein